MEMETTTQRQTRGFASIATPDGRFRIWLPRPTAAGTMHCNCGFGLMGHLPFADAIDQLPYVRVHCVRQLDDDFSTIVIQCLEKPYMQTAARLLDDLPRVMEEHL